jgi:hypothetical protein
VTHLNSKNDSFLDVDQKQLGGRDVLRRLMRIQQVVVDVYTKPDCLALVSGLGYCMNSQTEILSLKMLLHRCNPILASDRAWDKDEWKAELSINPVND